MKRFIFGFHRRVWWPKWTPASSNSFMEATDTLVLPSVGYGAAAGGSRREPAPIGPAPPSASDRRVGWRSAGRVATGPWPRLWRNRYTVATRASLALGGV